MKCEWIRENIVLHVYGELADDARHELEQHVARCADCALELRAEEQFHALLAQDRASEPSPNLLASSRMKLQEALETAQQGSFFSRLAFDPAASPQSDRGAALRSPVPTPDREPRGRRTPRGLGRASRLAHPGDRFGLLPEQARLVDRHHQRPGSGQGEDPVRVPASSSSPRSPR